MKKLLLATLGSFALLLQTIIVTSGFAQSRGQEDSWSSFRFFVGSWTGTGRGQPGISQLEREYRFILSGQYLQVKNKSVYQPQEKNPKGEVHEDVGLFSYDRARKLYVLRQFHVEGFVNQYKSERIADGKKTIVFVSEAIENIAPGWRARETYRLISEDEFIETFELAAPGKEFEVYTENSFKRKN
jgi:hypothetical protein